MKEQQQLVTLATVARAIFKYLLHRPVVISVTSGAVF